MSETLLSTGDMIGLNLSKSGSMRRFEVRRVVSPKKVTLIGGLPGVGLEVRGLDPIDDNYQPALTNFFPRSPELDL